MLYSKLGSIPKPETDGTEGWIEVPDAPACPEGKEVVWWGSEWVIRDPKPQDRAGYQWNWNHGDKAWVECAYPVTATDEVIHLDISIADSIGADTLGADSVA
jgi:hypothetical protein